MNPATPTPPPQRLGVRVRRTLLGEGGEARTATIYCPVRERSLSVDECTRCEDCAGMAFDASQRGSFVLCRGAFERPEDPQVKRESALGGVGTLPIAALMTREVVCVDANLSLESLLNLF